MTRIGRGLLVSVLAGALVAAAAPGALAHAAYKDSDPADGATVSSPPSQITAEFTEPLTDSSSLEVYDPCGTRVDDGNSRVSGYEMSIGMAADKAGAYTVRFAAQSALDAHVTRGSFSFSSSGGAACPGAEPPPEPGTGGGGGGGAGGGGSSGGSGSGSGGAPGGGGGTTGSGPAAGGPSGSGGGRATGSRAEGDGRRPADGTTRRAGPTRVDRGPVAFQETGGERRAEPAPWDLPIGGVLMALVLCVMIGAAGGRVYAGIVAPPRR